MARVPDSMARYATYELSEHLRQLTPAQRDAIGRIVQHHYIDNRPMAQLFTGDGAVCSENTYYKRGFQDRETGEWRKVGWSHQEAFTEALDMAARLAIQQREGEELAVVRETVRRARLASAPVIGQLIRIASDGDEKAGDRISASKVVLDLATRNTDEAPSANITISVNWDGDTDE